MSRAFLFLEFVEPMENWSLFSQEIVEVMALVLSEAKV